jgi:hypothetical protein
MSDEKQIPKSVYLMICVNELRMRARWLLGQALAGIERGAGRPDNSGGERRNFKGYIKSIGLKETSAKQAQRMGCMPETDLVRAFALAREHEVLVTTDELIKIARPYWYQASRKQKHQNIAAKAEMTSADIGPFPLIYADPPWKFEVYSDKGPRSHSRSALPDSHRRRDRVVSCGRENPGPDRDKGPAAPRLSHPSR